MYYEALLWLILVLCTSWITLFTLNPNFVRVVECDDIYPRPGAPPDAVKCLIFAVILGMITAMICAFIFRDRSESSASEFYLIQNAKLSEEGRP